MTIQQGLPRLLKGECGALRLASYFRQNWGAPFVVTFMALLVISAGLLSFGASDEANAVAVYAFYSLLVGVALQIASYVKYGEGEIVPRQEAPLSEGTSFSWTRPRIAALAVIGLLAVGSAVVVLYNETPAPPVTHQTTYAPLQIHTDFVRVLPEPDNVTQVVVGVSASGGNLNYSYAATWGDGFVQRGTLGLFVRVFQANQTIPSAVGVSVESTDGQTASLSVPISDFPGTTSFNG